MINPKEMQQVARNYETKSHPLGHSLVTIGALGSHSALDITRGGIDEGFRTLVACVKGREKTYEHHRFRTRGNNYVGCITEELVLLDKWKDIVNDENLQKLSKLNTILIPHRSMEVYLKYDIIENQLRIPFLGNRELLRWEERTGPYKLEKNQDNLVKEAGLPTPMKFSSPSQIDRKVMIKSTIAIGERDFQRAGGKLSGKSVPFPVVSSPEEYEAKCQELMKRGRTDDERKIIGKNFRDATIEEYMGDEQGANPGVNLNYFYSVINDETEFMGSDKREQYRNGEEFIHIPVSLRESKVQDVLEMGERFVEATKKICPPGIIGPFALQTITSNEGEEMLVIDASLRNPGSPDTAVTPYTTYKYGEPMSLGRRIAKEIKEAILAKRLEEIVS